METVSEKRRLCSDLSKLNEKPRQEKPRQEKPRQNESLIIRQSGLELLRLLSMAMIVGAHMVQFGQPALEMKDFSAEKIFLELVFSGGPIGVVCFFAISSWFMSDMERELTFSQQAYRVAKLWLQTVVLTIPLFCVGIFLGVGSAKLLIESVAPVAFGLYWFIASYALFLLFVPFLKKALISFGKSGHLRLLLICIALWTFPGGILPVNVYDMDDLDVWMLLYLYIIISYLRWYGPVINRRRARLLIGGGYSILVATDAIAGFVLSEVGVASGYERWLGGYDTKLPILMVAIGLFSYFKSLHFSSAAVNSLAKGALTVYVIHNYPFMKTLLWNELFPYLAWSGTVFEPFYVIGCAVFVTAVFLLVDYPKRVLVSVVDRPFKSIIDGLTRKCSKIAKWADKTIQ